MAGERGEMRALPPFESAGLRGAKLAADRQLNEVTMDTPARSLVERLREYVNPDGVKTYPDGSMRARHLILDAADEIERLTGELERARAAFTDIIKLPGAQVDGCDFPATAIARAALATVSPSADAVSPRHFEMD